MPSNLPYASFANYSPRGQSDLSQRSRKLRDRIKAGDAKLIDSMMQYLVPGQADNILSFLGKDQVLVPMPGSALTNDTNLWVPKIICERLVANGFGKIVAPILRRTERVPKSAFAAPGERPTARRHYETTNAVDDIAYQGESLTIVDDFITKGSTGIGCGSTLAEAYPGADVRLFAMIRTLGLQPEIDEIRDPSVGTITYDQQLDSVQRKP